MKMTDYLSLCVSLIAVSSLIFRAQGQENTEAAPPTPQQRVFPVGDPRRCLAGDKNLLRLGVNPGGGWDNLRNVDAGMVMKLNYSQCLTTDDGRYLVPDGIYTTPKKSSKVDKYAELFMHWNEYTSTLSNTINANAGLKTKNVGISGKFSDEFESVKTRQFFDKTATTRVQARYVRYNAKVQPDFDLTSALQARLRKIAANIEMNRTSSARHESQLVVRDFGTHVITSVDIGAAMVQVDQVKSSFVNSTQVEKNDILAAASASFFGVFNLGLNFSHTSADKVMDQYLNSRTESHISTFGGSIFRPTNYTSLNWITSLENELVALDRAGDPLYFVVTSATLPDLPQSTIYKVYDHIKTAVELYYKHNTYRGCTDRNAPNFSFMANKDDGTCKPPKTNYTFGGVYQTCSESDYTGLFTDLCAGMRQQNPLTGDYSCPDEYEAVLLQEGSKSSSITRHECHTCWILWDCCDDKTYDAHSSYSAYWCSAKGHIDENNGFLFGGLFSSVSSNPLTGSMDCPPRFYALRLLKHLAICVSGDYELGVKTSLPFAGMFSCKSGNPLALNSSSIIKATTSVNPVTIQHSLMSYMMEQGSSSWPRGCPPDFSHHLAIVDNGCEISYCIHTGALSHQSLPKIQRPPFIHLPHDTSGLYQPAFVFNDDGTVWTTLSKAEKQFGHGGTIGSSNYEGNGGNVNYQGTGGKAQVNPDSLTTGAIVAIAIGAALAGVLITVVVVVACRKWRNRQYRGMRDWNDCLPVIASSSRQ